MQYVLSLAGLLNHLSSISMRLASPRLDISFPVSGNPHSTHAPLFSAVCCVISPLEKDIADVLTAHALWPFCMAAFDSVLVNIRAASDSMSLDQYAT